MPTLLEVSCTGTVHYVAFLICLAWQGHESISLTGERAKERVFCDPPACSLAGFRINTSTLWHMVENLAVTARGYGLGAQCRFAEAKLTKKKKRTNKGPPGRDGYGSCFIASLYLQYPLVLAT